MVAQRPHGNRAFRRRSNRIPAGKRLRQLLLAEHGLDKDFFKKEKQRLEHLYDRLAGKIVDERGGRRGGVCCSHAWAEDNWEHGKAYPPGGDQTLMVRCRGCGAMTPPNNVGSSGHCDCCRIGSMSPTELENLPKSAGIIDMGRLKASRRRGETYPNG